MNDVYPTVIYSRVNPADQNVPLKPFFVKAPVNCSASVVGSDGMTLLTLMSFASSGRMKTEEGPVYFRITVLWLDTVQNFSGQSAM